MTRWWVEHLAMWISCAGLGFTAGRYSRTLKEVMVVAAVGGLLITLVVNIASALT